MAWRCRFPTARPSQDGRVIAGKAPDALVDFHTGADMMSSLGSDFFAGGALGVASSAIAAIAACFEDPGYGHHSGFRV